MAGEQQQVQVQANEEEEREQQAPAKMEKQQVEEGGGGGGGSGSMFGCSICLSDFPRSPVLTCCGHLFCWPCICRWALTHRSCPVCKGFLITLCDFTPIFSSSSHHEKAPSPAHVTPDGLQLPPLPHAHRKSDPGTLSETIAIFQYQHQIPRLILQLPQVAPHQPTAPTTTDHITPSEASSASSQEPPTYDHAPSAQEPPTSNCASSAQGPPRYPQRRRRTATYNPASSAQEPPTYNRISSGEDLRTYLQRRHSNSHMRSRATQAQRGRVRPY